MESLMEEEREEGMSRSLSSSGVGTLDVSGNEPVAQGGDEVNKVGGASRPESMRWDSPVLLTQGLIASMERDTEEAGLGGWFNGNPEDVLESWSGANSNASASQDRV